ncbi:TetR family transcriptional regulator [Methylopila henanensis]|uniref:TetR family transcriptional regulator n=1 Tax=Methylopila henanensis TaxID=873516 RepID=A0ABW4K7A2_9HYPH
MRKTKAEAEKTRDLILDAAEMSFFENGVARSSLDDIARAAGVTRGAVYWHFENKVDLFMAVQERASLPEEELCARFALQPDRDPLPSIGDTVCELFRTIAADERQTRVMAILLLRCEYTDDMVDVIRRQHEAKCSLDARIAELFQTARDRGQLNRAFTPELAQGAFRALVFGLMRRWLELPEEMDLTTRGCAIVQAFVAALSSDPAPA